MLKFEYKKEISRIVKYINKNEDTIATLSEVISYIVYLVSTEDISQSTILKKILKVLMQNILLLLQLKNSISYII